MARNSVASAVECGKLHPVSIAIVVSGLPASGKSTVGRLLARSLGHNLLDKDDFLEELFRLHNDPAPSKRSEISREADTLFIAAAKSTQNPILVSHWRRPEVSETSGTPTAWLGAFDRLIEVCCECPADVAVARFQQRSRHPSHGDSDKDTDQLIRWFRPLAELGPLGIGELRRVDSSDFRNLASATTDFDLRATNDEY